jgi:hypothetical protein
MENTFFLPVGRKVLISTVGKDFISGELRGIINFGGIPAIWIVGTPDGSDTITEHICLLNNVCSMSVTKENGESKTFILNQ